MTNIEVSEEELSQRRTKLPHLLRPICLSPKQLRATGAPGSGTFAWYVVDNSNLGTGESSRFRTLATDYLASYYEIWNKSPHIKNGFFLERAYLHIYRRDKRTNSEQEYLLLHCDPNEPTGRPHWKYKRSPHLHFEAAEHPLPRSHISLALLNIDDLLLSCDSFTSGLKEFIVMIKEEVLDLIK